MTRRIPLAELGAEVRHVRWTPALAFDALLFDCPLCRGGDDAHPVLVPYQDGRHQVHTLPEGKGLNVWGRSSGTGPADFTLTPSVHLGWGCRLHCFIRAGAVEVL